MQSRVINAHWSAPCFRFIFNNKSLKTNCPSQCPGCQLIMVDQTNFPPWCMGSRMEKIASFYLFRCTISFVFRFTSFPVCLLLSMDCSSTFDGKIFTIAAYTPTDRRLLAVDNRGTHTFTAFHSFVTAIRFSIYSILLRLFFLLLNAGIAQLCLATLLRIKSN